MMQIGKKKFIACITAAFVAGGIIAGVISAAGIKDGQANKHSKLDAIYEYINNNYYQEADKAALMDGACKGLVSALDDPYSAYMTSYEYDDWVVNLEGKYSGIGISITSDVNGSFVVVSVNENSPAERAGIKEGDIITAVDGKAYDDMERTASAIRGKEGSKVSISYKREDQESVVDITRENIVQHSVKCEKLDSDTAYIRIDSFLNNTDVDFTKALDTVEKEGVKKLVLDLRNNGGGLLSPSISIADEFIDEGPIVYLENKAKKREAYEAKDGKRKLNMVVLVNENTASAAEILAAALQDNGFTVVGQTTFGKGVVQSTSKLEDGSALKLTVMQYFSPKGKAINEKGITPDVKINNKEDSDADIQLEKALELLKRSS